ncbi:hypothetical protein [Nocardioides salarius]|uniref:hypothetical protein n=1 Tax=Nocardioides salarius TaxID=374513 RepID=UPI0030F69C95
MPYDLSLDQDREDRRKHLDIIQSVVARQAASSAATKGWAITLAAAIFGVAVVRDNAYLVILAVAAVVVLSVADALYLHNEQRFRDLYDAVARNETEPFSMDLGAIPNKRTRNKSYWSWSVAFIYAPLLVACLALSIVAITTSGDEKPGCERPGHKDSVPHHGCHSPARP